MKNNKVVSLYNSIINSSHRPVHMAGGVKNNQPITAGAQGGFALSLIFVVKCPLCWPTVCTFQARLLVWTAAILVLLHSSTDMK